MFPSQLSGGQQQLVGVARAVIQNPKLILADEPTGNLHSEQGDEIMMLFKRLNEAGTTIIQVTHSERNATYGNRVIQLKDGWVVSEGKPEQQPTSVGSVRSRHSNKLSISNALSQKRIRASRLSRQTGA